MNMLLSQSIAAAFAGNTSDQPDVAHRPAMASRRRKLWELSGRWHCPLIGTCLPVAEMRKLAGRAGLDARQMTDYTLHTVVVGSCDERSELAELIQRYFDKRYSSAIERFGQCRDEAAVLALWRETLASGEGIAGALWAASTHAALSEDGSGIVYGDMHMLSHQTGAEVRADLRQLERLKQENARLRDEAQALRIGLSSAQSEKDRLVAELRRQLDDAERRAAQAAQERGLVDGARQAMRDHRLLQERASALAGRAEMFERRHGDAARRVRELDGELARVRHDLAAAEAALEFALARCEGVEGRSGCGRSCPAEVQLAGRCVLCVGGLGGQVAGYRRLVETQGGRFLHHDGGQEESLHRIDAVVAAADAVVCQSGCVSHAAYYRLKEACRKLAKPCVFVDTPGLGSFARTLAALGGADTTGVRLLNES